VSWRRRRGRGGERREREFNDGSKGEAVFQSYKALYIQLSISIINKQS